MSQNRLNPSDLEGFLRSRAAQLGFDALGFAEAGPLPEDEEKLRAWLDRGDHDQMTYLERYREIRRDPRHPGMLEGAKTVVCLAMAYPSTPPTEGLAKHLAAFARGPDYHGLIRSRLRALLSELKARSPGLRGRALVDSAPLFERAWARRAGLGFIGHNTCLIHPDLGSMVVLGELILDVEITSRAQVIDDRCGSCRACVEACPTGALSAPEGHRIDARRCLSYWTIEAAARIPPELAGHDALFGCDACQLACPWNAGRDEAALASSSPLAPLARYRGVTLEDLAALSLEEIHALIRGTALERAGASALRRRARQLSGASSGGATSS